MGGKDHRHQAIVEILKDVGKASVTELGARLDVTEMTIRRDLEALEEAGALTRFHGGAKLARGSSYEPPLAVREKTHSEQKRAIGRRVAELVDEGATVIVDGGSTGLALAEALIDRHLTVCALSLRVAWVLSRSSTIDLLIPPGSVRHGELSLSGAETTDYLRSHRFDHYLMTASGLSAEIGLSEWNLEDAAVKRAALNAAAETIVAIDSSKVGSVGFVSVCALDRPDTLVLDDGLSGSRLEWLASNVRNLEVASLTGGGDLGR